MPHATLPGAARYTPLPTPFIVRDTPPVPHIMRLLPSLARGWVLAALIASPALAHLGFPDTTSVTVRRGHPEQMLLGATFGAVMTRDAGRSWRWLCTEALGYGSWRPETYLWLPNGDLFAATGSALIRSTDGGCTWSSHEYFAPPDDRTKSRWMYPIGLVSPDSQPSRLWVSTARSGSHNGLYRSDDGGKSFAPTSLASDSAVFLSVKVAPSDTRRLYVSSSAPDGLHLWRSGDEGVTWEDISHAFSELVTSSARPYDLFMLKVSDTDPDRLWARVTAEGWTYVMESRDGGRTFRSVVHPEGQSHDGMDEYLIGIEVSADGDTLWAATPTRLFRIHAGDATATHLSLPDGNACAERQGDTLFVCGASRVHDWALAITKDQGATYMPLFNLPDMLAPAAPFCPQGTPVHDTCRPLWPNFATTIEANPSLPPDALTDAGTPGDAGDAGNTGPLPPDAGGPAPADAGIDGPLPESPEDPPKKNGCSSTAGLVPTAGLLALTLLRRSRRSHLENPRP